MSCDILCLSEALVEFNQVNGPEWRQGFGGDVSNVAVAAARQGARTGIATRLGDDGFGRALMEMWEAEGVDTSAVSSDPGAPTGLYFVRHGIDGHKFEGWRRKGIRHTVGLRHALSSVGLEQCKRSRKALRRPST